MTDTGNSTVVLEEAILQLEARLDALAEERDRLIRAIKVLRELVHGTPQLPLEPSRIREHVSTLPGRGRMIPGTGTAIQRVLADAKRPMFDEEILVELQRRGWMPNSSNPLNAVRASLSRLNKQLLVLERLQDGRYRFPKQPEAPPEEGASDHPNQGGDE